MSGTTGDQEQSGILASSAVMAAGTVFSRLSGFLRSMLLLAALGAGVHADVFTVANTVPNMLYILLAGGVFNAVLVPQLVRSMQHDADGGEAYTNRVVTAAALFLGIVTVLLVIGAPLVMEVVLSNEYDDPALAEQQRSAVDLARFCLPQVFFYGMFVLVGQILNARERFGPMMWAPIANNVISVAVLGVYLLVFGPASGPEQEGPFTAGQEAVLGLGSTAGILAQLLILIPYLRSAGFTFRPRFDLRGTGLGHTARLGIWTVLFVVVNQAAYVVVVRLASGGPAGAEDGTGVTVYTTTLLIMMVPHSVVTVSLATAVLPALSKRAAAEDLPGLASSLSSTLRSALAIVLPFAALLPVMAPDLARSIAFGAAGDDYRDFVPSLSLVGLALAFFTLHYLHLRGFYALELTRTVFFIQCAVAATNIVAAVVLVSATDDAATAPALVGAYAIAYAVGALTSFEVLRRRLGGLQAPVLVRFLVRVGLAVAVATAASLALAVPLHRWQDDPSWLAGVLGTLALTLLHATVFVVVARALRLREVTGVIDLVSRRLTRTKA